MLAFLFTFVLTALLIGTGLLVNLHLRPPRLAPGRRVGSLRRAYVAPLGYTPAVNSRGAEDMSTRYTRKAVVTSILLLLLLGVILIGAINAVVH